MELSASCCQLVQDTTNQREPLWPRVNRRRISPRTKTRRVVAVLIVLQQHLSSAIFVMATAMAMFFIAGGSIWQILASGALGSLPLVVLVVGTEYRLHRVLSF